MLESHLDGVGDMAGWDLIGVGTLIGTVVTATVAAFLQIMKSRYDRDRQQRTDTLTEFNAIISIQKADLASQKLEIQKLIIESHKNELMFHRALSRIEHLEEALAKANIPVKPWNPLDMPGSGLHTPLPDTGMKK